MTTSTPQNRSAARLMLIAAEEHVETNPEFAPGGGLTHCNAFAQRVCNKMGASIPLVLANAQHAYLLDASPKGAAWERTDAHTAQAMADTGCLAVASWANPIPDGHGHIAILVPSLGEEGVWVAAAGAKNFTRTLIQHSFGVIAPDYFVHA